MGERSSTLTIVGATWAKLGNLVSSKKAFLWAFHAAKAIQDDKQRNQALIRLTFSQATANDVNGGIKTASFIDNLEERSFAFQHMAWRRNREGDKTTAKKLIQRAILTVTKIERAGDKLVPLQNIMGTQVKMEDLDGALRNIASIQMKKRSKYL